MYSDKQVLQYFERIHYWGFSGTSLENLVELQKCHLQHIPYENLDLMNGTALSLDPQDLFSKIIERHRGGFCFELQGVFYELLISLGYQVKQYAARFMDEPWHIQMRRHRILVVELGAERYVCDVGVRSESPRIPLQLQENEIQNDGISQYRYRRDPFYGWVLEQKEPGKEWKDLLGFTEEPQINEDYVMPTFYCEKHSDSTFNKFMKISIFTPDSNLTIVGNTYKVYKQGKVVVREPLTEREQVVTLLKEKFGIPVPVSYQRILWNTKE